MFQTICAVCHGFDGKRMNFKDDAHPEFVGTVASGNPWEFVHKVRFGQPGVAMIGLVTLPTQDIIDLLAYAQTLPVK
jgi:thiosulfate dehydrogenase